MSEIRILLADDQLLLLQSLKLAIETLAPELKIVATACNGKEAIDILENQVIDVALLDVRMPVMDGIQAAQIIRNRFPSVSIIMLTTFEDEIMLAKALALGVNGYLLKNIAPEKLISGIRAVRAGSMVLGPDVAGMVARAMGPHEGSDAEGGQGLPARPLHLPTWFYELTPREKTLVRMLLRGETNKEISSEINLAEQTVRNYMSLLYEKLGVSDRHSALEVLKSIDSAWWS
jgi:DNA-binding NarL/FixJ family response regulator